MVPEEIVKPDSRNIPVVAPAEGIKLSAVEKVWIIILAPELVTKLPVPLILLPEEVKIPVLPIVMVVGEVIVNAMFTFTVLSN